MSDITNPVFQNEDKAREHLEATRWPDGPQCPHCAKMDATRLEGVKDKNGKVRKGLYQCNPCRKQFTVTVGTLFERSHIPLRKWLLAFYLLSSSKKGISTHQLHRMLGVTYKTAWFMTHRIREAMRESFPPPIGGEGKTVEVDETFIGNKKGYKRSSGFRHKHAVLTLVERDGPSRSFHVQGVSQGHLLPHMTKHIAKKTAIKTDEAWAYKNVKLWYPDHQKVNHSAGEYVRGDSHTNTIEGFFSIFKRGMIGVYQHCGEKHLFRYLGEFDFRYSNRKITDWERTSIALKGIEGKRLTYRRVA